MTLELYTFNQKHVNIYFYKKRICRRGYLKDANKKIISVTIIIVLIISSLFFIDNKSLKLNASSIIPCTYAVISNQSTDQSYSAFTGTFSALDSNLGNEYLPVQKNASSYKIDYVKKVSSNILNKQISSKELKSMAIQYTVYQVGSTKLFWTYNFETEMYTTITATLKSSGTYSNVWVNTSDYNMSITDANKLTSEFDSRIYPKITQAFAFPSDVDKNSKTDILCYDIKDGFSGSGGYIAGYFDPTDLYPFDILDNQFTNKMEVFYIDVYPSMNVGTTKDVSAAYETIAHEFQHMVNYNQNVFIEQNTDGDMDIWLQEAFSEAASQIYSGRVSTERIDYYNSSSSIANGFSLIVWEGELENYSLAYLFSQYLKEQVGIGDLVFKEIMIDTNNNYMAVENVVRKYINPNMTFGQFMTAFRAALFLKRRTGLYGFKGNKYFDSIEQKIYTGNTGIALKAGGAIIVEADSETHTVNVPLNKGSGIFYLFLQDYPVISILPYTQTPVKGPLEVFATTDVGSLNESNHTFNENGSYDFVATNIIGDMTIKTVTVDNIDKIPPTIYGVLENGVYSNARISLSDGTASINNKPFDGTLTVRSNGAYQVVATDIFGNASSVNFSIINSKYQYLDEYVSGIIEKTKRTDFLNNINLYAGEDARAYDLNAAEINDQDTIIGTGMSLKILESSIVTQEYKTIIYGDSDGDASISVFDLSLVKSHLLGRQLLNGAFEKAGDVNKNKSIDIIDLLMIKKHILGMYIITQ